MICENIELLMEESSDVDASDLFILRINDNSLLENLDSHYKDIGIILEVGTKAKESRNTLRGVMASAFIVPAVTVLVNPLLGIGLAVLTAAAAITIKKYLNSIYRLTKVVNYYQKLVETTTDENKQSEYETKLKDYEHRLQVAKNKVKTEKKQYIEQTNKMKSQLSNMKKSNSNIKSIDELEKKISARKIVLSKINNI